MPRYTNSVFGLQEIGRLQAEGNWISFNEIWSAPSPFRKKHPFGYWVGGDRGSGGGLSSAANAL